MNSFLLCIELGFFSRKQPLDVQESTYKTAMMEESDNLFEFSTVSKHL